MKLNKNVLTFASTAYKDTPVFSFLKALPYHFFLTLLSGRYMVYFKHNIDAGFAQTTLQHAADQFQQDTCRNNNTGGITRSLTHVLHEMQK